MLYAIFRTLAICVLIELLDFKWKDSTPEQHAAFADLVVKCLLKPTKALEANIRVGLKAPNGHTSWNLNFRHRPNVLYFNFEAMGM